MRLFIKTKEPPPVKTIFVWVYIRGGHNKARGPTPALSNLLFGPSVNYKDNKKNYKHI